MRDIFSVVKKYIDEYDYIDLLALGAPNDEYDIESNIISTLITGESSVEEIADVITSVMNAYFDEHDNVEKYMEIAEKIKKELSI